MTEFLTNGSLVVPSVTADQMQEIDRIAIEETGPNLFQMMENAGRSLAGRAIAMIGDAWPAAPIVVLAGTGGNGGGGICAARHLANRGAEVVLVLSDANGLGAVPRTQLGVFEGTPGGVSSLAEVPTEMGLVIDALIGYSLSGVPRDQVLHLIEFANASPAPVLALDVPSGVDATTGETPGNSVEATSTLTLALPKTGLNPDATGELWLADLGIPEAAFRRAELVVPPGIFSDGATVRLQARTTG